MIKYKQQAYYIDNPNSFFVDRSCYFLDEKSAFTDLEKFAVRTENRIPNKPYNIVVSEIVSKNVSEQNPTVELLLNKLL